MEKNYKLGIVAACSCSFIWGILPIYWKTLVPIPSSVIIFYRIFWVGVVSFLVALKLYGWERIKEPLRPKGRKAKFLAAGVIITINWSIYIWAVNAGYILQTSIGYYIQPILVAVFGIVFFKEKITKYNGTAIALACIAVLIIILHFGEPPTIAIFLAVTFAVYGALKKNFKVEAILSLLYETMFLVPLALAIIIYLECTGQGALGVGETYQYVLLQFAGVATAIPLGLFAIGTNNLPLVTVGVTSYISPTMALLLGVFMYNEPFDAVQFVAFAVIWLGIVIFTIGEAKMVNRKEGKLE